VTLQSGERLVIDASVAVKWVIPEPDSERAELDRGLVAPDVLFAACANALWKKVRRGELTKGEAEIAAQTLEQADLTVVSTRERLALATLIAVELDDPAYDAVYLAAAEAFSLPLVTADDRGATIHVRVGGRGPAVVMLHGFGDTGDMWAPLAAGLGARSCGRRSGFAGDEALVSSRRWL
jgi:predicted nucleic acid-binding protein